jgi:hypothetical protein
LQQKGKVMNTGAVFSDCRRYRYRLWRIWDASLSPACFILMNPSTADEIANDPTVERCQRRAAMLGYGGLIVVNVFAWRETDSRKLPKLVAAGTDITGPDNDAAILSAARESKLVVCGWGKPGELNGRGRSVVRLLNDAGITPHALAVNADGSPKHPLYIGYSIKPTPII